MTPEETIQQILTRKPEIKREQVLEKLHAAREKTGSLIADDTLLRMIAAEFGVEIPREPAEHAHKLSIAHLVPGLNDVTVTGRVVAVYPVKTFEGKKPGKFASVTAVDRDGVMRVVLWNEKADAVESGALKAGQVARFSHGYTKEDRNGTVELHLSSKSEIEINSPNALDAEYPSSIGKFAAKIKEITSASNSVNLNGTVKQVFSSSTFIRQDGTEGTVMRFVLADETGELPIVVWNEKAAELEHTLQKDAQVQLINGRVKTSSNGSIEVHVDASTFVEVKVARKEFAKISGLSESLGSVNVEGEVASVPVSREVKTSKGETVKLVSFDLQDDSGVVRFSAWRNHAEIVGGLLMGRKIVLENVYVKKGFDGKLELSTRTATVITVA
jgi:ssDNA-binding replication factor A large subunit